ncbi:response regulator [Streptomyces coeruleoprunus]|uniref:Response regulator n=1 Tax=Streptomyces coeruleoprunus TaxID=285563 RepID=A0ABV9XL43_9ACTN
MPDDVHVSQHTSAHPTPLSSPPAADVRAAPAPAPGQEPPTPLPLPHLRVVVADDNAVVRAGLTALLSGRDDIEVCAEAADGREAYEAAVRHRPDVVLLDVRMPGVDGLSALPHLARLAPVLMTTYSGEPDVVRAALRLGACGYLVHGEFTPAELTDAVRAVRQGKPYFTHTASMALLTGGVSAPAYPPTGNNSHDRPTPLFPRGNSASLTGVEFAEDPSLPQVDVGHSLLSQREVEVMDLIASGMTNQQIAATCFISHKTVKNHINRIFAKLHAESRGQAIAIWHSLGKGGATSHG